MPRRLPGAIALGLLASLLAHAAVFGGDHEMGGAYHTTFLEAAAAGCAGLLAAFAALAWAAAGRASDGSIVASRLAAALPRFELILGSAAGWYALGETIEPRHAPAALAAIAVALALAAWLVLFIARAVVGTLAKAVLSIFSADYAPRAPVWSRRRDTAPTLRRTPLLRRRFARPPPRALLCA